MTKIITFSGFAGAGKDTAAKWLCRELNLRLRETAFILDAFAKPLHQTAQELFGDSALDRQLKEVPVPVERKELLHALRSTYDLLQRPNIAFNAWARKCREVAERAPKLVSPRWFMQQLGTEVGRALQSDLWLQQLYRRNRYEKGVLITDARFLNELMIGGTHIFVARPGCAPVSEHPSEALAMKVSKAIADLTVFNPTTYTERVQLRGPVPREFLVINNHGNLGFLREEVRATAHLLIQEGRV